MCQCYSAASVTSKPVFLVYKVIGHSKNHNNVIATKLRVENRTQIRKSRILMASYEMLIRPLPPTHFMFMLSLSVKFVS
jgi:hypothetical protein